MKPPEPNTPKECRLEDQGFRIWLDQGDKRSFQKVAQVLGLKCSDVINHARKFGWKRRSEEIVARASEITMEGEAESLAAINKRQLADLREAMEKAMNTLRASTDLRPNEAIRMLDIGMKMERQITGADGKEEDQRAVLLELIRELTGRDEATKKLTLKKPLEITAEPAEPGTPADLEFEFEIDPDLMAEADETLEELETTDGSEE